LVSNEGYTLEVLIEDKGIPMPEEALNNADGSVFDYDVDDMESWPTSGMGLSLIKAVMNTVEYHADSQGNILRMVKNTLSS
jgi:anti-sigma regulatory factor (Ser/Thr protein kinase)